MLNNGQIDIVPEGMALASLSVTEVKSNQSIPEVLNVFKEATTAKNGSSVPLPVYIIYCSLSYV